VRTSVALTVSLLATVAAMSPGSAEAAATPAKASAAHSRPAAADRVGTFSETASCVGRTYPIECQVSEPNVVQPWTNYGNQIQFYPGDHITVTAGGCVQTGGHGDTWKRYVDPAADNGLYHGTIYIDGTTETVEGQIWRYINRSYTIASRAGLYLGYQDDGYSDNGYWGHDNGTGNQCKNVGNAWVHITIN
jgi:hypothetical protein